MGALLPALKHPTAIQSLDIQHALWDHGLIRAAGAFACLIAAYAVVNDAIILNSDHDFGFIADATSGVVRLEFVPARHLVRQAGTVASGSRRSRSADVVEKHRGEALRLLKVRRVASSLEDGLDV